MDSLNDDVTENQPSQSELAISLEPPTESVAASILSDRYFSTVTT